MCLDSLAKSRFEDAEVIVVDNGSTDGSKEMILEKYFWVRLIKLSENMGFARACNEGIKASNADEYLRAGASAVAIGGSVFSPSRIKNKEFDAIKIEVSKFVLAVKLYYSRINKISN